jgi:multiple sugar transport system substrate-binding protein
MSRTTRYGAVAGVLSLLVPVALAGCSGGGRAAELVEEESPEATQTTPSPSPTPSGPVTLTWATPPDPYPGGPAEIAKACAAASDGRYSIDVNPTPADYEDRRAYLEARFAGRATADLVTVDHTLLGEFVEAGYLAPLSVSDRAELRATMLAGPLAANTVDGQVAAFPLFSSVQLLWYRRSVARKAGVDLGRPTTWARIIAAAESARTTVQVNAGRNGGYLTWLNALIEGAGGSLLQPDSEAGRAAAAVIRRLATSKAADPQLDSATLQQASARFFKGDGSFLVGWPGTVLELPKTVTWKPGDLGWTAYPRTAPDRPAQPPVTGLGLAISRASEHQQPAVEAARCITSRQRQVEFMLSQGYLVSGRADVYDDKRIRQVYSMADLLRESLRSGAPTPIPAADDEVSRAMAETFWPPQRVDPQTTPRAAQRAVVAALQ